MEDIKKPLDDFFVRRKLYETLCNIENMASFALTCWEKYSTPELREKIKEIHRLTAPKDEK